MPLRCFFTFHNWDEMGYYVGATPTTEGAAYGKLVRMCRLCQRVEYFDSNLGHTMGTIHFGWYRGWPPLAYKPPKLPGSLPPAPKGRSGVTSGEDNFTKVFDEVIDLEEEKAIDDFRKQYRAQKATERGLTDADQGVLR